MSDAACLCAALVLPYCSTLAWCDSIPSRFAHFTSVAVIAAYAVAAAVYYGFERQILRWRDRIPRRKPVERSSEVAAAV
jgi:peptidoglycan/LPS O-acetylase OafA/YrhL